MKEFLKHKGITAGLFMMAFYQIAMLLIFMSGYSAVPKNATELTVAVVNEDEQTGSQLVSQLKESLPFKQVTNLTLVEAKEELENRDVHLIIHVPQDFTEKMGAQGEKAQLDFFINESNANTITSIMQNVINQISSQLSKQTMSQGFEGLLQGYQMSEEQSKEAVQGVMDKVVTNVVSTNQPPNGLHNMMAPMFLSMAIFVGSMIYSMMSTGALNQLKSKLGKRKAFLSLQGINVLFSLIVPLIGVSIYFAIQGYEVDQFFKTWMVHSAEMFTAISFTSVICLLAGQGGMLINMLFVLMQSIACGATIPREMMPDFFKAVSYISPMYYSVHLDYNVLFGGGNTSTYFVGMILIAVVCLVINSIIHGLKPIKENVPEGAALPSIM